MSSVLLWCQCGPYSIAGPPTRVASVLDRDAHRTGGARDDLLGLLDVVGVQVGHLLLGHLAQLGAGDRADLVLLRHTRALVHAGGLEQQPSGGRGPQLERERAVLVDADLGRDDVTALGFGPGVVGLDELHDVHAVLAERGADRRRRGGLARRQLKREGLDELLLRRHGWFLSSWDFWQGRAGCRPTSKLDLRDLVE